MNPAQRLRLLLDKYKYMLLVLLIGLGLMLLPTGNSEASGSVPQPTAPECVTIEDLETRLEQILRRISGVGDVEVLLTERTGAEVFYQTDTQSETDTDSIRENADTVLVENEDNRESGLVRRTDPPVYLGAVVVCQGGDDPNVRLAVVEAVRCATGLGANQISVIKMN